MTCEITQRQLRNQSGETVGAVDAKESSIVTRTGVAVGEFTPIRRHRFVNRDAILDAFAQAAPIDSTRFRRDARRIIDHDLAPRA